MSRLVTLAVLIVLVVTFGMKNDEELLSLKYFFGLATPPLPVYQVVLAAFILGGVFVVVLLVPEWVRLRLELRRHRKLLKKVDGAVSRMRPPEPETEEAE